MNLICANAAAALRATSDTAPELRRLVLAWFDGVGPSAPPPTWLEESVFARVPSMPPDVSDAMSSLSRYRWLRLASAFDFSGDLDGARALLDRLETTVPVQRATPDVSEFLALLSARRGRLARQMGAVDAAVDWYQRGLARAGGVRDRDAWGACVQGLAACAQFRGDLATAERLSRLVARNHAVVPIYARVAAMLTLAVIHRKRGRIDAALRCAWQAHDLVEERDERRGMALVELSNLALSRGQLGAAQRGFGVVLSFARTMRVRRPALSGLLGVAVAGWRDAGEHRTAARQDVLLRVEALLTEACDIPEPWERLHARFDALDAYHRLGVHDHAERLIGALQSDVEGLQFDSASVEWARHRLRDAERRVRVPDSCTTALLSQAAGPASAAVAAGFARLSTLQAPLECSGHARGALVASVRPVARDARPH
jgi:tetratricopeptide (TPR) repeat protein